MIVERWIREAETGMTKLFALRLLERVLVTFGVAFVATYTSDIVGGGVAALTPVEGLSLAHKALVAGIAALVQLVLSTLLAPHVGDANSPDLVPGWIINKVDAIKPEVQAVARVVEKDDPVASSEVEKLVEAYPTGMGKSNV